MRKIRRARLRHSPRKSYHAAVKHLYPWMVLGVLWLAASAWAREPTGEIAEWIAQLASPDPTERHAASEKIRAQGQAARSALSEAARSPLPEISTRAGILLQELPWWLPSDPPEVRKELEQYATMNERDRIRAIGRLHRIGAADVLLRMLPEESGHRIQWEIVNTLRFHLTPERALAVRQLKDPGESPPVLAIQALAWLSVDRAQTGELLDQALARQQTMETPPVAYQLLLPLALKVNRTNAAADMLRRQATDQPDRPSKQVLDLFALHATAGPLKGLDEDLLAYRKYLGDPRILYALSKTVDHPFTRIGSSALEAIAFAAGEAPPNMRQLAGAFLVERGWTNLATREWEAALAGDNPIEAHFQLSRLAAAKGNDFLAAEHLRLGLEQLLASRGDVALRGIDNAGHPVDLPTDALWTEIHWRYLRAAEKKNDTDEMGRRLDRLVELNPDEPHFATDIVPALKRLNRPEEAKVFFDRARAQARAKLDADPDSAEHRNNLAWLYARCDEQLDEALKLAREAVAAQPDNAAYLDTLAEAQFRLGNHEEAIRLETRALEIRPDDAFMREQLERFRAAAANGG